MTRRPAVTLMEVLIAMFIMAIGMLALMALFPVGAVSMAKALKDDRCAYASITSENVAIVTNVRYGDSLVNATLNNAVPPILPPPPTQLVYVDPCCVAQGVITPVGGSLLIPRTNMNLSGLYPARTIPLTYPAETDYWFSLPDDIGFNPSGTPDLSNTGGIIDRGRRYNYAFLLRQVVPAWNPNFSAGLKSVQLFAVVYNGRPISSLATTQTEWPYVATVFPPPPPVPATPPPTNGLVVAATATTAKRGGWLLDATPNSPYAGSFYRITNIADNGVSTTLETQQNLQILPGQNAMNIVIMDYVAEVFDKGFGWQQ